MTKYHEQLLKIVEKKGIPEAEREEEVRRIEEEFDERVIDELLTALPEEKLEEMKAVLSEEGDEADEKFFRVIEESGVSFDSITKKILSEFLEEYLGETTDKVEEE